MSYATNVVRCDACGALGACSLTAYAPEQLPDGWATVFQDGSPYARDEEDRRKARAFREHRFLPPEEVAQRHVCGPCRRASAAAAPLLEAVARFEQAVERMVAALSAPPKPPEGA